MSGDARVFSGIDIWTFCLLREWFRAESFHQSSFSKSVFWGEWQNLSEAMSWSAKLIRLNSDPDQRIKLTRWANNEISQTENNRIYKSWLQLSRPFWFTLWFLSIYLFRITDTEDWNERDEKQSIRISIYVSPRIFEVCLRKTNAELQNLWLTDWLITFQILKKETKWSVRAVSRSNLSSVSLSRFPDNLMRGGI